MINDKFTLNFVFLWGIYLKSTENRSMSYLKREKRHKTWKWVKKCESKADECNDENRVLSSGELNSCGTDSAGVANRYRTWPGLAYDDQTRPSFSGLWSRRVSSSHYHINTFARKRARYPSDDQESLISLLCEYIPL